MDDHLDLDRGERASIVLRADLRGALPRPEDIRKTPSPQVAKLVLFVLDSFPPDRCFPSEELLARCACAPRRTLQRALAGLLDAGLVETRTRPSKGTRYRSSRFYVIRYDILASLDHRAHSVASSQPASAGTAPPVLNGSQPAPERRPSQRRNGAQQQAKRQQNLKSKQEHPGKRTAATVKADLDLANVVQELTPGLIRIGVARNRVTALVIEAGSRERIVEVLDLLKARSRRATVRNPGGFIAQAIRDGWRGEASATPGAP